MPRPERQGVMLAHPAIPKKLALLPDHIFIQPKLRGERCRVEYRFLVTSYGNPFYFLDQIEKELKQLPDLPYDGEIYLHGKTQEWINSAANRTKNRSPNSSKLEYHIFDLCNPDYQKDRLITLNAINDEINRLDLKYIKVVSTMYIPKDEWETSTIYYTDLGYEGLIIRNPNAGGYIAKRTNDLLKFKPTEIDYYRIEEVIEAISDTGFPKGMVGSFWVSSSKSDWFRVGAGKMDHRLRTILWEERKQLRGKDLEVKHEKIRTEKGIPLCCVAINVKNFTVGQ